MWVVTSLCATLSDYVTMVEFMQHESVTEAFVACDHRRNLLQLCCLMHEDEEVNMKSWFPSYAIQEFDNDTVELDQPLSIEGCVLISTSNSSLVHAKNLANTRLRLCDKLGQTALVSSRLNRFSFQIWYQTLVSTSVCWFIVVKHHTCSWRISIRSATVARVPLTKNVKGYQWSRDVVTPDTLLLASDLKIYSLIKASHLDDCSPFTSPLRIEELKEEN